MKFKKGDSVMVISGKDKGNIGLIRELDLTNSTLIIEGINLKTYHVKPTQQNPEGGILKKEAPIHSSNVMLNIGGKTPKVSKIGFKFNENKKGKKQKVRVAKATGEEL